MNSGKHEQEGDPFTSLHIAFGPQGDGAQGLTLSMETSTKTKTLFVKSYKNCS